MVGMSDERVRAGGRARSLTRDQVVDAALEVLRGEGLERVSFRAVAARLGVNPMALYTYVGAKDDLLAAMFDRIANTPVELLRDEARAPLERLADFYVAARRLLIEYADLYRMARPAQVVGDWSSSEVIWGVYAEAGIEPVRAGPVADALLDLAVGSALRTSALHAAFGDVDGAALASQVLPSEGCPLTRAAMTGLTAVDREDGFRRAALLLLEAHLPPSAPAS
jgi:AcrR family transcriptional regulator